MAALRSYHVSADGAGKRLDVLLAEHNLYCSRSAAVRAIEEGRVLIGGVPASKKERVCEGQTIVYELDDAPIDTPLVGEPIELDIRYEDDDIIMLSKQAGLVCHPTDDHADGTLVNALIYCYGASNLCNVQGECDRLGIVHRLDRDTSGLMLAAKTNEAGQRLMDAIAERAIDRHYLALVHGIIGSNTGMIDAPIARHPKERLRMAVRDSASARDAVTTFEVLERFGAGAHDNGYTLVDCKLFTGRTHQIRVHMEYIGHPVVGDLLYTTHRPRHAAANLGLERQFLHSYKLCFNHPITGAHMQFEDELPADLQAVMSDLRARSATGDFA